MVGMPSFIRLFLAGLLLFLFAEGARSQTAPKEQKLPEPKLGALYHYDYAYPKLGLKNPDGSDALSVHPPETAKLNLADPLWHRRQLDGMISAKLDFFAPLYARADRAGRGQRGLRALVKAWDTVDEAGGEPPLMAPFFDTELLLGPKSGGLIKDLRQPKDIKELSKHLASFFDVVPDYLRFRLGEFLIIFVGPSYGIPHDRDVLEKLADALGAQLKTKVFVVAEHSWQARRPAGFRADAALMGPRGDTVVRFIGPGYDDSRLAGRGTPKRDREKGRFYRWSFDRVLLDIPTLVVIDSWNDFRQGTAIAPSREYGTRYLDLTRRYAARLKSRVVPDAQNPVRLAYPDPRPRPDTGWFKPKEKTTPSVARFLPGSKNSLLGEGLRLARAADGPFRFGTDPKRRLVISPGPGDRYLYFGIADEFASRVRGSYRVRVRFIDGGRGKVALQYDSWDRSSTLDGRYRSAPRHRRGGLLRERSVTWILPDARFSNRQNGGTDFRLRLQGDDFELLEVSLEAFKGKAPDRPTLVVE